MNVITVSASERTLLRSWLQECDCSHRFKHRPQSPLHGCYRSLKNQNVTAVTSSRMFMQSPLHQCDCSHRFKNLTAVTASRILLTSVTASRMFPWSCIKNVPAVIASGMLLVTSTSSRLPQSPLQECDRSHRLKNVAAVTAS